MYELKNDRLADDAEEPRETVTEETGIMTGFSVESDEMYVTLEEYKRMYMAEILLRVILAADIDTYGTCNGVIDAVRQVYATEIMSDQKENENAE